MNIAMAGLDYALAPIELRERLSFTKSQAGELAAHIRETRAGVLGCVLISTCNRTEIYLSCGEGEAPDPAALLCAAAGQEHAPFSHAFVTRRGEDAARHLCEVAAGLKSQIWGEDQIVSQVKTAIAAAREFGGADSVLETLFRTAVSAAKEVKTNVRLTGVSHSAAQRAVEVLERELGGLEGRTALVIGNGEMGRLAAGLLRDAGCAVTVTLRSYHHGETVVPRGCAVAPYEERYAAMERAQVLVSATTSPHFTVTAEEFAALARRPAVLVDLAIPRDIQPEAGALEGVRLFNVDQLGEGYRPEIPARVGEIIEKHMDRLRQWAGYRERIPAGEQAAPRFPLFIDLRGRRVVMVGGGAIACRRISVLQSFGAEVTVVAPVWKGRGEPTRWLARPYEKGDLNGALLAVAATDDRAVNRQVGEDARALGIPVSVADAQEECTFFFPAVCLGDGLVAGVVSDGVGHRRTAEAAKAIRKTLEELA